MEESPYMKSQPELGEPGGQKGANWNRNEDEARGYGAARQPTKKAPEKANERKDSDRYRVY